MPIESRVLTDVSKGVWLESFELTGATLPLNGSKNWSLRKRRLRGGTSDGVDVVEIDNGALKLEVLPTRGMGLWRGSFQGIPIGWNSPVKQPVHPAFVNLTERGGLGWLEGFNELLCRCGLAYMGAPGRDEDFVDRPIQGELTLHGRIANLPAHRVEVTADSDNHGRIAVTGVVDECSMFGPNLRLRSTLETTVGSNRCTIIDEVTNLSAKPAEFEMLYHANIGRPFLEAGSRFDAPIREMSPRNARAAEGVDAFNVFAAPNADYSEQVYFFRLAAESDNRSVTLLRNAAGDLGISLRFSLAELPCFTLWKNTAAEADGYVTGLEPGTNFPNPRGFERQRGRLLKLAPGASHRMTLELAIHPDKAAVQSMLDEIARVQSSLTFKWNRLPQSQFSPDGK